MNHREISRDLNELAHLLIREKLVRDVKSIYDASGRLYNLQTNQREYECIDIVFYEVEGAVAGCIPVGIRSIEVTFSIKIKEQPAFTGNTIVNPLADLKFDIEIQGLDGELNDFYASWHLDKHLSGGAKPNSIHPEYHLTFGGNRLESKGVENFGRALILPTPRIIHPPMDIFLGVDFILQNYFPYQKIANLLEDSAYQEIIERSQHRLWYPYYSSIFSKWEKTAIDTYEEGFRYSDLNPFLT